MYILVSILILITCVLLVLVVLVQNSKGGGLASNFSSSNQFMGVRKTADFLEKSTWTLAVILLTLSMLSIFVIPKYEASSQTTESEVQKNIQEKQTQPIKDFQQSPAASKMPPVTQPAPAKTKK